MKNLVRNCLAAAALTGFALSAHAVQIVGAISLGGAASFTGGDINTATSLSSLGPGFATQGTNDFSLAGQSKINTILDAGTDSSFTMTAFGYGTSASPALVGGPLIVWTTTNAGITTSFRLDSITLVDHNVSDQVTLKGTGVFFMDGRDATAGTFNFTANQAGQTFSFSSSQIALAPDAGSTALLLGLGLGCLGIGARRFKARKA